MPDKKTLARIKELRAKEKKGELTPEETLELKGLAEKFPKSPKCKKGPRELKSGNDFAYWNKFPGLVKSVTSYPWMHITGTAFPEFLTNHRPKASNVVVTEYLMVVGKLQSSTDAYNLVIRDLWLGMHRKYRGLGAYQQADLGIALVCIMSLFAMTTEAERLYGIIHDYPVTNRVNPVGLLKAMGYDDNFISDLMNQAANYRARLNRIIIKIKRLCLPKGFTSLYNWIGLNGFIYCDAKDNLARANMLVFQPWGYYKYDAATEDTGGSAVCEEFVRSDLESVDQYLSKIEAYADVLLEDDDIARICSDIIACFGDGGLEALSEMPENYSIAPRYEESILIKFHNSNPMIAKVVSDVIFSDHITDPANNKYRITQVDNCMYCMITVSQVPSATNWVKCKGTINDHAVHFIGHTQYYNLKSSDFIPTKAVLDTWETEPSEATRCESFLWRQTGFIQNGKVLTAAATAPNTHSALVVNDVSTEVLVNTRYVCVEHNSVVDETIPMPGYCCQPAFGDTGVAVDFGFVFPLISQFDWHPLFIVIDTEDSTYDKIFGDLDNYTIIDESIGSSVRDAAVLSGFTLDINMKQDA